MSFVTCVSCDAVITVEDVKNIPSCACGQQMFCNPHGYGGGNYFDGIYRNCLQCGELITGPVVYTQHLHDACHLKQQQKQTVSDFTADDCVVVEA